MTNEEIGQFLMQAANVLSHRTAPAEDLEWSEKLLKFTHDYEALRSALARFLSVAPVALAKTEIYGGCIYCRRPITSVPSQYRTRRNILTPPFEPQPHQDWCLWARLHAEYNKGKGA